MCFISVWFAVLEENGQRKELNIPLCIEKERQKFPHKKVPCLRDIRNHSISAFKEFVDKMKHADIKGMNKMSVDNLLRALDKNEREKCELIRTNHGNRPNLKKLLLNELDAGSVSVHRFVSMHPIQLAD